MQQIMHYSRIRFFYVLVLLVRIILDKRYSENNVNFNLLFAFRIAEWFGCGLKWFYSEWNISLVGYIYIEGSRVVRSSFNWTRVLSDLKLIWLFCFLDI